MLGEVARQGRLFGTHRLTVDTKPFHFKADPHPTVGEDTLPRHRTVRFGPFPTGPGLRRGPSGPQGKLGQKREEGPDPGGVRAHRDGGFVPDLQRVTQGEAVWV